MKNLLAFLFLAVFLTVSAPAFAADYTADEIAFMTSKAVFEDPATEKKMRSIMPDSMTKMNGILSTSTGAVTKPVLAATTSSSGATLVGVYDVGTYFTATALEGVLQELGLSRSKLALTTSGNGASLIGVYDVANYFTGTTVEAVLAELGLALSVFSTEITVPVNLFSATAPADPNVNGYRVFMTSTNGGLNQGYIYVWNDTTNAWDAGTLLGNGQMVASKGTIPDVAIGGTLAANFVKLSGKMNLTVPASVGNIAILGADGQPTDSGDTLAEYAKLVATPTNGNLLTTDALGQPTDSAIASADISSAIAIGGVAADKMRNSTNTAQSLADATAEIVDLEDVEVTGDVTYAAGTTSLATIPATGLYAIQYSLVFAAGAGTYNEAHIYINAADAFDSSETPDNANPITVDDFAIRYLAANDTVALWGKQDSGDALNTTAGRLSIQRIQ